MGKTSVIPGTIGPCGPYITGFTHFYAHILLEKNISCSERNILAHTEILSSRSVVTTNNYY